MRSSPNFLAVSRRGLGLHLSLELSDDPRSGSDDGNNVSEGSEESRKTTFFGRSVPARHGWKAVLVAVACLLQGVVLVINEIFDVVDNLSFH